MRERARDKGRLQDIVEYSANVTMLIEGYDNDMLVADKRTYLLRLWAKLPICLPMLSRKHILKYLGKLFKACAIY